MPCESDEEGGREGGREEVGGRKMGNGTNLDTCTCTVQYEPAHALYVSILKAKSRT